jgi:hypothetical protein
VAADPTTTRRWAATLKIVGFGLITVTLAIATVVVGTQPNPNKLATSLLQVMTLLFGVLTSYFYSKISASDTAREVIRPHARASIRRSVTLFRALQRQDSALTEHFRELEGLSLEAHDGRRVVDLSSVKWSIVGLQHLVTEQLATAGDSLEDWRDIVPEEVDRIYREVEGSG